MADEPKLKQIFGKSKDLPEDVNQRLSILELRMDNDPSFTVKQLRDELLKIAGFDPKRFGAHLYLPDGTKLSSKLTMKEVSAKLTLH